MALEILTVKKQKEEEGKEIREWENLSNVWYILLKNMRTLSHRNCHQNILGEARFKSLSYPTLIGRFEGLDH